MHLQDIKNARKGYGLPTKMERMQVGGFRRVKEKIPLTKAANGGIINKNDIIIPRSIGAAGKNYPVKLPNGNHTKLVEGTTLTKIKVFMGYGTDRPIRDRFYLESEFGIPADKWQKVRGEGFVLVDKKPTKAELHWYEAEGRREKMKVKEWLDEG